MMSCCKVENCVGNGLVVLGYGAAVWGNRVVLQCGVTVWCCSVGYPCGAAVWGNRILIFWKSILPFASLVSKSLLDLEGEWKLVKVYSFFNILFNFTVSCWGYITSEAI
jgi:hypothetical protein